MRHFILQPRRTFISLLIVVFASLLHGCSQEPEKVVRKVPQLTELNIHEFVDVFQNDYENTLDTIVAAYDESKANDDPDEFIRYRNLYWTPDYIDMKNYYAKVLHANKAFLARKRLLPLFTAFDHVLKIGLDLKKAITQNDERYHFRAMDSIQKDRLAFTKIVLVLNGA